MEQPDISQLMQPSPDPNAMPQASQVPPAGPELATPEQIQELHNLMDQVKNAQASLTTSKLIKKNETSKLQKQLMQSLFTLMQGAGVDPNPESIKMFLGNMEQQHPDLLELFIKAFSNLSGGPLQGMMPEQSPQTLMGGGEPTGSLMDNFRSLSGAMPPEPQPQMQ